MDVVFSFTRDVIVEHKAHLQRMSNLGRRCSHANAKNANMNVYMNIESINIYMCASYFTSRVLLTDSCAQSAQNIAR